MANICPLPALFLSCARESNIEGERLHSRKSQSRSGSLASRAWIQWYFVRRRRVAPEDHGDGELGMSSKSDIY